MAKKTSMSITAAEKKVIQALRNVGSGGPKRKQSSKQKAASKKSGAKLKALAKKWRKEGKPGTWTGYVKKHMKK